jgi:hypothetical protein
MSADVSGIGPESSLAPRGAQPDSSTLLTSGIPAWLLSLALHTVLILILAWTVRVAHRGIGSESDRGGGIVLARVSDGMSDYFGEGDDSGAEGLDGETEPTDASGAVPSGEEVPLDLAGMLPQPATGLAGSDLSDSLPSAAGFASGARPAGGRIGANQVRTSIFGAEGTGSKFVYVFDRSASMDSYEGRPMAAAKSELIASLADLEQIHQFQIIFYNHQPMVFNPSHPLPPRMLFGDAQTKRLAQNFVRGVIAAGGTSHVEALQLALGMQPDVIFFLTDADEPQLTSLQLEDIRRRNASVGASIHAIEFGAGPNRGGLNFLARLAQENGGGHVYVDVTRLPSGS